jgi:capsular polysaccharide transport system ATP-binding protein
MIVFENVYKHYNQPRNEPNWVLEQLTFTIPFGLSVGIIGSHNSGKSTLIRLIGGIEKPSYGQIQRQGRVSWPIGAASGLHNSLSGRQNAQFIGRLNGYEEQLHERLAYIQDFSGLGLAFDEPLKNYSPNMRSRLQFSLSIAFDFDVYISDEIMPTGDQHFKNKVMTAFKQRAQQAGFIIVSHVEATLKNLCSAGIWLHQGRAYWFDEVSEALKYYTESTAIYD